MCSSRPPGETSLTPLTKKVSLKVNSTGFLQHLVKNHSTMTTLALQVDDYLNQFHYNGQKENQIILQLGLLQNN